MGDVPESRKTQGQKYIFPSNKTPTNFSNTARQHCQKLLRHDSWPWLQRNFEKEPLSCGKSGDRHVSSGVRLGAVGGDALSECPVKVGGEWLAEVYGDLWLLPQALIASSSVGSPGRPAVSSDQHQGSCRWAHQNAVYWDLLWRQMVSRSAPKPDDKQRRGREKRRDGQLVTERVQDFNLAFRDTHKKRVMAASALLVPIRHLSPRSAAIK